MSLFLQIRNELIQAGFDTIFQDVDTIWIKNPVPFLQTLPQDEVSMFDGRFDSTGPINTGIQNNYTC